MTHIVSPGRRESHSVQRSELWDAAARIETSIGKCRDADARELLREALGLVHSTLRLIAAEPNPRGFKRNSPIVVYANPPTMRLRFRSRGDGIVGAISEDVHRITYTHFETGEDLFHDFEPGNLLLARERGGVRDLVIADRDDRPLWGEYD